MDEQAQTPAPETEAPAAPVEPTTPDPAPETEAPAESLLDQLESEVVEAAQEAVAAAENVIHAVERRSFGRPSADHPVTVTTVFGGQ